MSIPWYEFKNNLSHADKITIRNVSINDAINYKYLGWKYGGPYQITYKNYLFQLYEAKKSLSGMGLRPIPEILSQAIISVWTVLLKL